ncbi:MAG: iron-sulfur cluster assembly protein, partial [Actinobacteria bacterium]|nr:iron-sulfur cluster assembly protein [Actinomycetota bacterium]
GRSIAERELIDEVTVDGDQVRIVFHLTVPFCPEVFATHIGHEIRRKALEVPGISKAIVRVKDHLQCDALNQVFAAEE